MKNAAFGQIAKSVYSLIFILSLGFIPGSHAGWGDRITGDILKKVASTRALQVEKAQVIMDNDRSFESKLAAIDSATESIDIIYYIFAEDFSSSKFAERLIKAAERGVKVRILVDYLTNLTRADLFLALENASENIEVKLYNKPTKNIIEDAVFMTTDCGDNYSGCANRKRDKADKLRSSGNGTDFVSRLFLTGLYSKTIDLIKHAVVVGQGLDPAKLDTGTETTEEDIKKLKELGKLIYRARIKGEVTASLKLWMAFQLYSDQVTPVYNLISSIVPIESTKDSKDDWVYLTDYTHHKFLLVDNKKLQLGGRNVEDSYHVKTNDMYKGDDKKYIFMDTDFYAEVSSASGQQLQSSYDRLWNFHSMTSSLSEVDEIMELEAIAHPELAAQALVSCKTGNELSSCAEEAFNRLLSEKADSREDRLSSKLSKLYQLSSDFDRLHKRNLPTTDKINAEEGRLSETDLKTASIYYIENLPFSQASWKNRQNNKGQPKRQYGADLSNEAASNKNIHELLVRGLEQACVDSKAKKEEKVVTLHNAYFFPSPNVMRSFGEMLTGKLDCSGVTVRIITNSYLTTDLFPVNAFASMQLKALFEIQNAIKTNKKNKAVKKRAAKFEYYEYEKVSTKENKSLHSKVSILGEDIIIGSANLDMRSYAMDSNNGVYIRSARELVSDYNKYFDDLIAGSIYGRKLRNLTDDLESTKVSKDMFLEQQLSFIKGAISIMSPKGAALFSEATLDGETEADKDKRMQKRALLKKAATDSMDLIYRSARASLLPAPTKKQEQERKRLEKAVMDLLSVI